jgi:hypothetical protein
VGLREHGCLYGRSAVRGGYFDATLELKTASVIPELLQSGLIISLLGTIVSGEGV